MTAPAPVVTRPARGMAGSGPPCTSPARTRRIGAVPQPRLRPLAEVLAAGEATPAGPLAPPIRAARPGAGGPDLDRLGAAARTAALSLFGKVAEILDGRRPVGHLRPLCDDEVWAGVGRALAPGRPAPHGVRGRVRGVRVCPVSATAAEVSGVVHRDGRARAVAARLERDGRTWRLRALLVG